jgi:hypothetical protein
MADFNPLGNVPAQTPPWMQGVSQQTMPQAMPGQLQAVSSQLAAGFGGKPADFMKHMDQVYDPVRSLNFDPTKKAARPAAATQAPGNYSNPRFSGGRWIVTKDGADMAFDPDAYHAGRGFVPLGGTAPAAAPRQAAPTPGVWNPLQGQQGNYSAARNPR